jgi:AAA domain-containing protein
MAHDTTNGGFPRALLKQSDSSRYNYFRGYTVAHPKLRTANEDLDDAIREAIPGSLIFVFGPSGVGKTTLKLRTEQRLMTEILADLETDRGRFSTIGVEAMPPDSGNFNWKDFYKRILRAMEEPCIDYKVKREAYNDLNTSVLKNSHTPSTVFRDAVVEAVAHRRPIAIFVDEAQHLAKMSSGRKLQDQLDSIKSLASVAHIPIALVGTYELLSLRNLSAQLSRRSIDVHFPRYRAESDDDLTAFKSVLWSFQHHLPLHEQPDLVGNWEYFYERSIGCVGTLKDWLARALKKALKDGGRVLKDKHLTKSAPSLPQCEKMAAEAVEGEEDLDSESSDTHSILRGLLKLEAVTAKPSKAVRATPSNDDKKSGKDRPRKRRVGERNPRRDPIGEQVA